MQTSVLSTISCIVFSAFLCLLTVISLFKMAPSTVLKCHLMFLSARGPPERAGHFLDQLRSSESRAVD